MSTVTCSDAFSLPMRLALPSPPSLPTSPPRTLASVCQVAGIDTKRKCPWVLHQSSTELADLLKGPVQSFGEQ